MYNLIKRNDPYQKERKRLIVIYFIKCNEHLYIGSSEDFCNRIRGHRLALLKNKHKNKFLQNCYNKYKTLQFGILQQFDSISNTKELTLIESGWWKLLKADLNLADPALSGGNHQSKKVYQYDKKSGNLIKEWSSITEASIKLNIPRHGIFACANPKVVNSKSSNGYMWSYKNVSNLKYINNTGSNLTRSNVELFENSVSIGQFSSIGEASRFLHSHILYNGDWKSLRTALHRSLKNGSLVEERFLLKYKI